jgi:hypothetical protein
VKSSVGFVSRFKMNGIQRFSPNHNLVVMLPEGETRGPSRVITLVDGESWRRFSGATRPVTIVNPSQSVELPRGAMVLRVRDDDIHRYAAHVSIPLSSLDLAPLTAEQFTANIADVSLPAPWGEKTPSKTPAKFKVENGTLEIDLNTAEPGAWTQARPTIVITLKSGQAIAAHTSTNEIPVDITAFERAQAEKQLVELRRIVVVLGQHVAEWEAYLVDHPNPVSSKDLEKTRADIIDYERRANDLESRLRGDFGTEIRWAPTKHDTF